MLFEFPFFFSCFLFYWNTSLCIGFVGSVMGLPKLSMPSHRKVDDGEPEEKRIVK